MIRRYQVTDLDAMMNIWAAATAVAHPFLSREFVEHERQAIQNEHLPNAETWVWEADGQVVGFVALIENEIGGLFVDPTFHRTGIGQALVNHSRSLHPDLEVEVFKDNALGTAFYAKYGFKPIEEKIHEPTGFTLMRLRLTDEAANHS